jgi:hypothetical protein
VQTKRICLSDLMVGDVIIGENVNRKYSKYHALRVTDRFPCFIVSDLTLEIDVMRFNMYLKQHMGLDSFHETILPCYKGWNVEASKVSLPQPRNHVYVMTYLIISQEFNQYYFRPTPSHLVIDPNISTLFQEGSILYKRAIFYSHMLPEDLRIEVQA